LRLTNDIEGFVLAGGANSRMGRPKADLVLGGSRFVDIAASALRSITDSVHIVGEPAPNETAEWIEDDPSVDQSSLRGLITALSNCRSRWAFVLACDLPFVNDQLAERIASYRSAECEAIVPIQPDGRLQPLCALYDAESCLPKAKAMHELGEHSLHSFVSWLNAFKIESQYFNDLVGSEFFFMNINTPYDFEQAEEHWS
jgi:molybdopterin-guanine dinucleotide biosynthesis protein A